MYTPGVKEKWTGRVDSKKKERFHQIISCADANAFEPTQNKKTVALLGFNCDEGVKRNQGRPGAREGPLEIRRALANLSFSTDFALVDMGDITCLSNELESAQEKLGELVALLLKKRCTPVVIGGGHEVHFGHYLGVAKAFDHGDLTLINFDAHYDLRLPDERGQGNSGTGFSQIAAHRKQKGLNFDYIALGIQKLANTQTLFKTAEKLNVKTLFAEDFFLKDFQTLSNEVEKIIAGSHRILVTLCLDVFNVAFAPGVSAPQSLGLYPWHVIVFLRKLAACGKVIGIDVAELAPPFDKDQRTAKLAASLIAEFITYYKPHV